MYEYLASELAEIEKQRRFRLLEATTMDAVTFLPTNLGAVKAKVKDLSKKKWKWGLTILEDDDGNKDVRIENALRIIVPKEHWGVFQEMFVGELNDDSYLNLSELLIEAMEDELLDLRKALKPALVKMYNEQNLESLDKTIKVWNSVFGIDRIITDRNKVAVTAGHKGRDIQRLYGKLLRAYGEDKGGLEMLLADIASDRPLGAYSVVKKYDYLYGDRVVSDFEGSTLILEAVMDTTFMTSESIYVGDIDVLDEIEDQLTTVKRVGNVIYPADERFDVGFFSTLRSILEDAVEEMEIEPETESEPESEKEE